MVDPRRSKDVPKKKPAVVVGDTGERPARQTFYTLSEDETQQLGDSLARGLRGGALVLLTGELGLGKTVLTRGIAAGLGIPPEDVSSPSFTLVQEYRGGRLTLYHVDLYRLTDPDELESLGIDELLSAGGVTVVEWGDKLPPHYCREAVTVSFFDMGEGSRRIEVHFADPDPPRRLGDA